jgi:hypothetical protein
MFTDISLNKNVIYHKCYLSETKKEKSDYVYVANASVH